MSQAAHPARPDLDTLTPLTCCAWWVDHWDGPLVGLVHQVLVVPQVVCLVLGHHTQVHVGPRAEVVVDTSTNGPAAHTTIEAIIRATEMRVLFHHELSTEVCTAVRIDSGKGELRAQATAPGTVCRSVSD